MKRLTFVLLVLSAASFVRAADSPLQEIRLQRIDNLNALHELLKTRHAAGEVRVEEVHEAAIALYTLQRDQSHDLSRHLPWQEKIAATEAQRHALVAERVKIGELTQIELLRSLDRHLAAQEKLLELQWATRSPK